jgi:hypothetical protein
MADASLIETMDKIINTCPWAKGEMMNKKIVFLGFFSVLIAFSCTYMKKEDKTKTSESLSLNTGLQKDPPADLAQTTTEPTNLVQPDPKPLPTTTKERSHHYEVQKLDDRLRAQAKSFGFDPKTYRMPIRTETDGTNIYRVIGMHIIVNPSGEEVYLPDSI